MTKLYMATFATFALLLSSSHLPAFQSATPTQLPGVPAVRSPTAQRGPTRLSGFMGRQPNPLRLATEKLKAASDDNARDEARREIRTELEKQYDRFLEDNKKQISDLQDRLDKLRDQLERRRAAKTKMVDLEMERVVNEAEGLIWPKRSGVYDRRNPFGTTRSLFPGAVAPVSSTPPTIATPPRGAR